VGAAAQSVSGIGFALVSGPLLFTVFGAREGVRVAVVLSMRVNAGVLAREHRAVMWRRVCPVLVTALALTPALAPLLEGAHPRPRAGSPYWAVLSAADLAGLQAGGADVEALARAPADHRADGLDVGVEPSPGAAVRVRDAHAEARPLAADVADGSHGFLLITL